MLLHAHIRVVRNLGLLLRPFCDIHSFTTVLLLVLLLLGQIVVSAGTATVVAGAAASSAVGGGCGLLVCCGCGGCNPGSVTGASVVSCDSKTLS